MPEGPELHHASVFINNVCKGRVFAGKIVKSEVHKSAEVSWDHGDYTISSTSRGKEIKVTLSSVDTWCEDESKEKNVKKNSLDIMIQFGMSGRFNFCDVDDIEKHSHLNFYTKAVEGSPSQVLSFVDYRRFGKWQIGADWSPDRGPCVLLEYPAFRENVLNNLSAKAFNKPICEVLLNQKYFNGIGNYLRAEILYRCGIRPFECARTVLEKLIPVDEDKKVVIKSETPDILELCHLLPKEVVNLGANGYTPNDEKSMSKFMAWLQCYYNPAMKNMADHNKRTIWYTGDPGPMVPKETKTRGMKKSSKMFVKRKSEQAIEAGENLPEILTTPIKKKKTDGTRMTRKQLKEVVKEDPKAETKAKSSKSTKSKKVKSGDIVKQQVENNSKSVKTSNSKRTISKSDKITSKGKEKKLDAKSEISMYKESFKNGDSVSGMESGDGNKACRPAAVKRVRRMSSRESTNSSSGTRIIAGVQGSANTKKRVSRRVKKSGN